MQQLKKKIAALGGGNDDRKEADDGVKDNFVPIMDEFVNDATEIATELVKSFEKSVQDIINLAVSFGEKKTTTVEDFFKIWIEFLASWGKAREAIRKRVAAEKKKQKLLEKKQRLKSKLEKRV